MFTGACLAKGAGKASGRYSSLLWMSQQSCGLHLPGTVFGIWYLVFFVLILCVAYFKDCRYFNCILFLPFVVPYNENLFSL
jgi:hypothetical protein